MLTPIPLAPSLPPSTPISPMLRQSHISHSAVDRRTRTGLVAVIVGGVLMVATAIISRPAAAAPSQVASAAQTAAGLTTWLDAGNNVIKVIQMIAFVFGAYQFWKTRKERLAADAINDLQARKDANYQAWQVVNAAQGKGGSGGRIDALADLARNRVSLAGVNLDAAWLEGIDLSNAILPQASVRAANLQASRLTAANLERADFTDANLTAARLDRAHLRGVDFTGARLSAASLDGADITDITGWRQIRSISHASVRGVLNAPAGFVEWAMAQGAVNSETDAPLVNSEFSREFRSI